MVARNVEDLDRAVGETLPPSDRGLGITAIGEPCRNVRDALGMETFARTKEDERRAEAGGRMRDVVPEHPRIHGELFLDECAEL
jgi:hypothetical protein